MREWEEIPVGPSWNVQKKQTHELEVLLDHWPWQCQKQVKRQFSSLGDRCRSSFLSGKESTP